MLPGGSRRWIEQASLVIRPGTLLGMIALCLFVSIMGQSHELFRILLEAETPDQWRIGWAAGLTVLLSLWLAIVYERMFERAASRTRAPVYEWTKWWSRRIADLLAIAPWLAAMLGIYLMNRTLAQVKVRISNDVQDVPMAAKATAELLQRIELIDDHAQIAIAALGAAAFGVLCLIILLRARRLYRVQGFIGGLSRLLAGAITVAMAIGLMLLDVAASELFQQIGPLATGLAMAIALFGLAFGLGAVARAIRMPSLIVVIALAALFAAGVAFSPRGGSSEQANTTGNGPPAFADAAKSWLAERKTTGQPTPMRVVAAEGGGMYAAIVSSVALSRLHAADPAWRRSVFAVSSVSGGSVGSVLFDAAVRADGSNARSCGAASDGATLEAPLRDLTQQSLFAPILGNVPADILRKFRPSQFPGVDRADALADSIARACALLAKPLSERQTAANGPALILNTTWMSNGHRVAFAPFSLKPVGDNTLWSFSDVYKDQPASWRNGPFNPTLAQAAVASARFPVVLPPLTLTAYGQIQNYGDGGYADASAVTTALEVYERMKRVAQGEQHELRPRLLMLSFDYQEVDPKTEKGVVLPDLMAPPAALYGVRKALSRKAITRALSSEASKDETLRIAVAPNRYGVGLGWRLSRTSYETLALLTGRPEWCPAGAAPSDDDKHVLLRNSCRLRDALLP